MRYSVFFVFALLLCFFQASAFCVDLSDEQVDFVKNGNSAEVKHAWDKQWFERIEMSGDFAVGTAYTRATGDLIVKNKSNETVNRDGDTYVDGSLLIEASPAEHVTVSLEWFVTGGMSPWYFNSSNTKPIKLGEAYVHFKNVLRKWGDDLLGVKVGNVDLPFGEEYLWQDKIDNPLIHRTAAWPWAWDRGILLYGNAKSIGWVASVTNGTSATSGDVHPSKAYNLKAYGNILQNLYVSGSLMNQGKYGSGSSTIPSLWLGNNTFPKKVTGSASANVSFNAWEADLVAKPIEKLQISGNYGQLYLKDPDPRHSRDLTWWFAQAMYSLTDDVYLATRYSFFGANAPYNSGFGGDPYQSIEEFRNDLKAKSRSQIGLGYKYHPNIIFKAEVARDKFFVHGPLFTSNNPNSAHRDIFAIESVMKF